MLDSGYKIRAIGPVAWGEMPGKKKAPWEGAKNSSLSKGAFKKRFKR
ncbi:hypothetical protein PCL1606_10480 [Pseudomonas chlororaphis]|uniref:Uncharacterized protein n=1 Tax=Pseudomonas chlororaphis TaxID=587753 RepID=A0A0D5XTT6_9PSED|nr:hypothetical protein PCL1606_10480 [Pseudomonas chlororaphis]